jgi:hypothetical protein
MAQGAWITVTGTVPAINQAAVSGMKLQLNFPARDAGGGAWAGMVWIDEINIQ